MSFEQQLSQMLDRARKGASPHVYTTSEALASLNNILGEFLSVDTINNTGMHILQGGRSLTLLSHGLSRKSGWWNNKDGSEIDVGDKNVFASKIELIHSEVSEALEAGRKDRMDDHLPQRGGVEVELADAVIRIFDLAGAMGLDLGGAILEKLVYNQQRADHKPENRFAEGGKGI